jgi:hypothetical protein
MYVFLLRIKLKGRNLMTVVAVASRKRHQPKYAHTRSCSGYSYKAQIELQKTFFRLSHLQRPTFTICFLKIFVVV